MADASMIGTVTHARELIRLERWCTIGLSYITLLACIASDLNAEMWNQMSVRSVWDPPILERRGGGEGIASMLIGIREGS